MATMYGIKDQWECSLSIGGKEYPAVPGNIVELNWFESIHQGLPSLNLTIRDLTEEFAKIASAGDGVKIEITLGDGREGSTSGVFNIQGPPQVMAGNGTTHVKSNAVLDTIEYNRKIAQGLYEGSSSEVISKLAQENGLTPIVATQTNDSQVWLPNNNSIRNFVWNIANHAYAGDQSAMVFGVSDQKELIYGDANQLIRSGEKILGYDESLGHLVVQEWEGSSSGMIANNFKSYGATTSFWSAEGVLTELNKISANLFGTSFSFSQSNAQRIGDMGTRLDAQPRPAGNTHDKYNEAAHINSRTKAMWNIDVNALIYRHSGIRLLEGVDLKLLKHGETKPSEIYTGRALLTAKTKSLAASKYVERLTLTTNGA